jgi:hypothetical protein
VIIIIGVSAKFLDDRLKLYANCVLAKAIIYKITEQNEGESDTYWRVYIRATHPTLGVEVGKQFRAAYLEGHPCDYSVGDQVNILLHSHSESLYWIDETGPRIYSSQ